MNQPIIYTPSERASYLEQWKASKLGLPAFSRKSGVPLTSLRYWIYGVYKKTKISQLNPPAFLPVQVTEDYCPSLEVILDLPKGMRMTLRGAITRYGWKKPDEAGLRSNIKAFSIISQGFNDYLENNNPELYVAVRNEINSYVKKTSSNGAKLLSIKAEIKEFFNDPDLIGKEFDGIKIEQVDELGLIRAARLLELS